MNDVFNSRFAGPKSPSNMQLGYFFLRIMLGERWTPGVGQEL